MTPHRSEQALQSPPDAATLRAHLPRAAAPGVLYREHELRSAEPDGGCWWFSFSAHGRFDLTDPAGTCSLGETEGVAARERCGRLMAMQIPITQAIYAGRVISEVSPPQVDGDIADLSDPAALRAGVTAAISTSSDYALCRAWAHACWDAGFAALRFAPRFTAGGTERAYAIFGDAGAQSDRGVLGRRSLLDVFHDLDYPVVRTDELTLDVLDIRDDAEPG